MKRAVKFQADEVLSEEEHIESSPTREKNYSFIANQNLTEFEGKWIAVVDEKVIASGISAVSVTEMARSKFPSEIPMVVKVPVNAVYSV